MDVTKLLARITVDPAIQHGKPCIKGTRTPVFVILEALAQGTTPEEVLRDFPPLINEDIRACIMLGALLAKEEEVLLSTTAKA